MFYLNIDLLYYYDISAYNVMSNTKLYYYIEAISIS